MIERDSAPAKAFAHSTLECDRYCASFQNRREASRSCLNVLLDGATYDGSRFTTYLCGSHAI